MSKRRPIQVALIVTALSHSLFTSCVDNDYDLSKDIDMTVTVGGNNLTLPGSNTDTISLRKIFDLDDGESNTLKTNRGEIAGLNIGDYYLKESDGDEPTQSTLTVEPTYLKLGESTETAQELLFANPSLIGATEDIQVLVDLTTDFNIHNEEIPGQLREMDWVELSAPVYVRINFTSPDGIKKLTLQEGLTINFADYLEFETEQKDFYAANKNVISITQSTPINENGERISVKLKRIDLAAGGVKDKFIPSPDPKDESVYGTIDLDMDIKVNGDVALNVDDFPLGKTTAKAEFKAEIQIPGANVESARGIIAPNFDVNFDPINFVDVPEFLNDKETNIDLYDPQIFITVNNTAPVGINVVAEMVGLDEHDEPIMVNGQKARIQIGRNDYEEDNALYLENNKKKTFALSILPHTYMTEDTVMVLVSDLNRLISKIPAKIGVENINPTVPQKPYTVTLNRTHDITTQYEIITPLTFGENLNFVYKDTLDGWNEDLEDIKIKAVEVELITENTIPMEMFLEATPIYKDDIERQNVFVDVQGTITAGTGNINDGKEGSIKVNLTSDNGELEQLDGLALKITGKSNPSIAGTPLNEKQSLRIKDVKLRIKDGITVDLN